MVKQMHFIDNVEMPEAMEMYEDDNKMHLV